MLLQLKKMCKEGAYWGTFLLTCKWMNELAYMHFFIFFSYVTFLPGRFLMLPEKPFFSDNMQVLLLGCMWAWSTEWRGFVVAMTGYSLHFFLFFTIGYFLNSNEY